ncbi:hypothetical protein [Haloarchaeobius amylolyticus]|uniref:hypothetical protein n=1 Tax=Haloarchaeobius amylolyticus TaxID=1198296 RepID=UPI00226E7FD2|nr:hypothetical protein [Haloarchaeobius amylolyticus]
MAVGTPSSSDSETDSESLNDLDSRTEPEPRQEPEISTCESAPGTVVFLESGNSDGWISSDVVVDVEE